MIKRLGKFKLFLVVAAVFVGAAFFVGQPFSNNQKQSPAYTEGTNAPTVTIDEADVALGIPDSSKTAKIGWGAIGIAAAVINLAGALIVFFISGDEKA